MFFLFRLRYSPKSYAQVLFLVYYFNKVEYMKKNIMLFIMLFLSLFNLISNEIQNKINDKDEVISFKIKPSIFFSGSSIQFLDNNGISYGDIVYNREFGFGSETYNDNLKEPVSENVEKSEVQKLCRKFYTLINFTIGTATAGLLSLLIIPGVFMVINSNNYPYNSFERIVLSSCGTGLIAGGSTGAFFLLVYGIILLVSWRS